MGLGAFALWTDSVVPTMTANSGTRDVPTASTEGMDLKGALGFRVFVVADSGKVLDGTGSIQFYLWDVEINGWVRGPGIDFSVTPVGVTWANYRSVVTPDYSVGVGFGRVVAACKGVGVDSGNLAVYMRAFN